MPRWRFPIDKDQMAPLLAGATSKFEEIEPAVKAILADVRSRGDDAVLDFTERFDGQRPPGGLRVPTEKLEQAAASLPEELQHAITEGAQRLRTYYRALEPQGGWTRSRMSTLQGVEVSLRILPLARIGVYVPGGGFPLVSSLGMGVVPAQVAGVTDIIVCAPPDKHNNGLPHPSILGAAHLLGVTEIYACGGAQAIAAMAFGTQSIARVDKIVGPGNSYVACAKKLVFGEVGIEMIAGPTEILIVTDASLKPNLVLSDCLAQLEHGADSRAFVVTPFEEALARMEDFIARQTFDDEMQKRIDQNLHLVLTPTMAEAAALTNLIAPEHLELQVRESMEILPLVRNAGAVFLGDNTPEAACDYFGGGNHVLPTEGTARFASALGPWDFIRMMPVTHLSEQGLKNWMDGAMAFARAEGLAFHGKSLQARFEEDPQAGS